MFEEQKVFDLCQQESKHSCVVADTLNYSKDEQSLSRDSALTSV